MLSLLPTYWLTIRCAQAVALALLALLATGWMWVAALTVLGIVLLPLVFIADAMGLSAALRGIDL